MSSSSRFRQLKEEESRRAAVKSLPSDGSQTADAASSDSDDLSEDDSKDEVGPPTPGLILYDKPYKMRAFINFGRHFPGVPPRRRRERRPSLPAAGSNCPSTPGPGGASGPRERRLPSQQRGVGEGGTRGGSATCASPVQVRRPWLIIHSSRATVGQPGVSCS